VSIDKVLLGVISIPFTGMIPMSENFVQGGKLEDWNVVVEQLGNAKFSLWFVLILYVVSSGIAALLAMLIIENESAVQKQAVFLLTIPSVWIFFLIYPGIGHEEFYWLELIGMVLVIFGSLYYV
jgi:ABC-type proline/glycine betaine transport system permease subunit